MHPNSEKEVKESEPLALLEGFLEEADLRQTLKQGRIRQTEAGRKGRRRGGKDVPKGNCGLDQRSAGKAD